MQPSLGSHTVQELLDGLASGEPTPGGGAASSLAGCAGAALVAMACNFTVGRPKFADVETEVRHILADSERLRADLLKGIDEDAAAFGAVMEAMRLPKDSPESAAHRTATLQQALKDASRAPLAAALNCAAVLDLCRRLVEIANPNVISDVAVAASLARAGLDGSEENVEINLRSIKDQEFVTSTRRQLEEIVLAGPRTADTVRLRARERMG